VKRKREKQLPDEMRRELEDGLRRGEITLEEAARRMRLIQGRTQIEYAKELGIATRTYLELERGIGNPRLETLEKIAAPFGYRIVFYPGDDDG
jgi:transcriptional regulator with XRE-family HTH domain